MSEHRWARGWLFLVKPCLVYLGRVQEVRRQNTRYALMSLLGIFEQISVQVSTTYHVLRGRKPESKFFSSRSLQLKGFWNVQKYRSVAPRQSVFLPSRRQHYLRRIPYLHPLDLPGAHILFPTFLAKLDMQCLASLLELPQPGRQRRFRTCAYAATRRRLSYYLGPESTKECRSSEKECIRVWV